MPEIGKSDRLERKYKNKFRALTSEFGIVIEHDYDRATIDLGLHLVEPSLKVEGQETVSHVKVWFQFKGFQATTITREKFETLNFISYSVRVKDVKFWYASAEPIYLTIYMECVDSFYCEDVRNIVDKQWGEAILNSSTLNSQEEVTLRLEKDSLLTEEKLKDMLKHRSIRIDTPSFRGRPLGHRIDPLRSTLEKMEPDIFETLIMRLLEEHGYETEEEIPLVNTLFSSSENIAKLLYGTMNYSYEWVRQTLTQFVPNGKFRIEGKTNSVQGKCAVLIHSKVTESPDLEELKKLINEINQKDIENFLVFVNLDFNLGENIEYIGEFTTAYRETTGHIKHTIQGLGEISFTLLTSTFVYLDFRDKISFKAINYL